MVNLVVGQSIVGAGIPSGARIFAVGSTTVTLNSNATATGVGVAIVAADVDLSTSLQSALENVILQLTLITANPKPSYSIDGQSVSWESYYAMLLRSIDELRKQIQIQSGPFELRTTARP